VEVAGESSGAFQEYCLSLTKELVEKKAYSVGDKLLVSSVELFVESNGVLCRNIVEYSSDGFELPIGGEYLTSDSLIAFDVYDVAVLVTLFDSVTE
jgi:hypothetical protein